MKQALALFVLLPMICLGQKNKPVLDSLEKIAAQQADSTLVKTYNELTWEYRMVDRDKAIEYGNKAISLGTSVQFPKGVAQAYNDLGIIFYDREEYDTAIALYQQSVSIRSKMNDQMGIAKLYNKIGIVYQKTGNFEKALEFQLKALPIFEQFQNDIGISYSLNNIGILQQNLGRLPEAISYLQRSITIKEKLGDNYGLAGSYVNLANIYLLQKNSPQAESFYQKAISIARSLGDKEYLSNALNNLGNQYAGMKKYDAALPLINESYGLRNELQDTKGMVSCLNNLADIYIEQQQYDTAKAILEDAINRAKKAVNCAPELNKLYLTSSKLYEQTGNTQKALEFYKEYATTKDSLFNDNLGESFAELETKYETVKKEQKIAEEQHKQKELQASINLQRSIIIGIAGLILLIALLIHSRYKRNKLKQEARLQAAILHQQELSTRAVLEAEEEERKRIARDLHDGVGQMMSAAKMNLSAFESSLQLHDPAQKLALDKVITLVDESCREVRSVSHNMMPNALLKNSLAAAVQDFIDKLDSKALKIHLYTEGLDQRLDSNTETVLYRVIQECVNNVIRHADANTLDISVIRDKEGISATIEDNGKGFNRNAPDHKDGIGLKNIVTRVEYLRGTVDFDSRPGKGTVVAVHVPLS